MRCRLKTVCVLFRERKQHYFSCVTNPPSFAQMWPACFCFHCFYTKYQLIKVISSSINVGALVARSFSSASLCGHGGRDADSAHARPGYYASTVSIRVHCSSIFCCPPYSSRFPVSSTSPDVHWRGKSWLLIIAPQSPTHKKAPPCFIRGLFVVSRPWLLKDKGRH